MNKTSIEWTDWTANPLVVLNNKGKWAGWHCNKLSAGCANCYAETMNRRFNGAKFAGDPPVGFGLYQKELDEMLTRPKKGDRVFVCDMTDMFGEWVEDEWLDQIFAVMALTPQHTYQVLTKRPNRMLEYLSAENVGFGIAKHTCKYVHAQGSMRQIQDTIKPFLPNVHLGVTVENQKAAEERIPSLLETPAAKRFLSVEPMLERVKLSNWLPLPRCLHCGQPQGVDGGKYRGEGWIDRNGTLEHIHDKGLHTHPALPSSFLNQVIIGGESGRNARPFYLEWAIDLIEQCDRAGVKVFFKQCGSKPFWQGQPLKLKSSKGNDLNELPEELQTILNRRELI